MRACLRFSLRACLLLLAARALPAAENLGVFAHHGDVGAVGRPHTLAYDAATGAYTLGASGANIWGAADAFGFVWREATGDVALAADIALAGASAQGHRKAGIMFRQSLAPDAVYADVMVHGDGHASLQFRSEPGGPTRTIQCPVSSPRRVRLEKRGDYLTLAVAGADGELAPSGCVVRLPLHGAFLAGLAVCAHDNAAFETARFTHVAAGATPPRPATRTSALEVLAVASLDRRVVHRADGRLGTPHFSPDGTVLYFDHAGRIYRTPLAGGGAPQVVPTGFATHNNADHGISPDGTQLAICDATETGKALMYLLPVAGGTPRRVPVAEPAYWHGWSPDGATLVYCAARAGNYDIYTVPAAGGAETRLTTEPGNDNGPDYSPDGQWIYYHSIRGDGVQVWRVHPDGSAGEQVTHDDYYNWYPHPSPDGKWLLVMSSHVKPDTGHPPDGEYVLRLFPTSGGGAPREAARFQAGNGSLNVSSWSRDSTRIAFASYEP